MRVMVLHAHPVEESFSRSLYNAVLETLRANGHHADPVDLYAEGFNPVMSREGRLVAAPSSLSAAPWVQPRFAE